VEAVNHLKVRSCLIDGEAVCCDEKGLAVFRVFASPAGRSRTISMSVYRQRRHVHDRHTWVCAA
jgi:ATP-dependent DNA ligase